MYQATVSAYKMTPPPLPGDVVDALQAIFTAMLLAERLVAETAAEHRTAFDDQMLSLVGEAPELPEDEPYLPGELAKFRLQFLQTMEKLFDRIERYLDGEKHWKLHCEFDRAHTLWLFEEVTRKLTGLPFDLLMHPLEAKAIDPKQPLLPQIEGRIAIESERLKIRLSRALDKDRQQASGVRRYIWRTVGDNRVRDAHADNDGRIFDWDNPPDTGHPGEDYNCRCTAEPVVESRDDDSGRIEPVYPELLLLTGTYRLIGAILKRAYDKLQEIIRSEPEPPPRKLTDILSPGGRPIGKQGNRPGVRVEKGGDRAARELYDRLSKGGTPDTPQGYPGEGARLPNGDWVGYRPTSKSGSPTVDLDVKEFPFRKIHFP